MSWAEDFLERHEPVVYEERSFYGDVLEYQLTLGFFAPVKGAPKFFPVPNKALEKMVHNRCREYIAESGQPDKNPVVACEITRWAGRLNGDPFAWRDGSWTERHVFRAKMRDGVREPVEDWVIVAEMFTGEDAVLKDYLGQRVWAHVNNVPFPSFDENDPSTHRYKDGPNAHRPFNSWRDTDGKIRPNRIPVVQQVFADKAEAEAWLASQSSDTGNSSSDLTWREAIVQFVPFPTGWDKTAGDWPAMTQEEWVENAVALCGVLVDKAADSIAEYHVENWANTPVTLEKLEELKAITEEYNPF